MTEWSRAGRLSVCINDKSQRRRSLHQEEVAAHSSSSSADDWVKRGQQSSTAHFWADPSSHFNSKPQKPSALGTQS